jgi:LysM repeat protein
MQPTSIRSNSALNPSQSPAATTKYFASAGESLANVSNKTGVSIGTLKAANPDIKNTEWLLQGQEVNIPDESSFDFGSSGATVGVSGAAGREATVQTLMEKAYQAGRQAPQSDFSGEIYRNLPSRFTETALDHSKGGPGRYNAPGERLLYFSPNEAGSAAEAHAYNGMADKTMIKSEYSAKVDAQGKGGVADIAEGLKKQNLPQEALTIPKGKNRPDLMHRLTGEHPYSLSQQVGKGAKDAGASAIRTPAAVGGEQIDIIPKNTDSSQIKPLTTKQYDSHGTPGSESSASHVKAMPADNSPHTAGKLNKSAGASTGIHETPASPRSANEYVRQKVTGHDNGSPRASSVRYGAAGGVAGSLINDAVAIAQGQNVSAAQVAQNAGVNGAVGAAAAKATDAMTPKIGGVRAGGVVAGVIEAAVSTHTNAKKFEAGEITASQATANVAVDTGIAVAAGASGAAIGAAAGSIVPVAGTAVGAAVGFVAGMGIHYGIQIAGNATGAIDAAKDGLAKGLDRFEDNLSAGWQGITNAASAIKSWF